MTQSRMAIPATVSFDRARLRVDLTRLAGCFPDRLVYLRAVQRVRLDVAARCSFVDHSKYASVGVDERTARVSWDDHSPQDVDDPVNRVLGVDVVLGVLGMTADARRRARSNDTVAGMAIRDCVIVHY